MTPALRVSEAAQLAGVSPSTLRAWEASGLIRPTRTGRYRHFSPQDVTILQEIAALRARGFSLAAIQSMLHRAGTARPMAARETGHTPLPLPDESSLGKSLRTARRRAGMNLRQASEAAGMSVSHLSAIERGTRNASLAGLRRLAVALGIGVSDLFGDQQRTARRLVRVAERPALDTGDPRVRVEALSAGAQLLEPHIYTVEPGGGSEGSYHHEGEEMVYVLQGQAEFWLNEIEHHTIQAGDCLTFPSTLHHRWSNQSHQRLTMLWVNTPITF